MTRTNEQFHAYWFDTCNGVKCNYSLDAPQGGRYWLRKAKDGPRLPVAIYWSNILEDGTLDPNGQAMVLVDGILSSDPMRDWRSCAEHPVEDAAYEERMKTGAWPGERPEAAPPAKGSEPGDNAVEGGAFAEMKREIEAELEEAERLLSTEIKTKVDADRFENMRKRLVALGNRAYDEMREKKKPIEQQLADVHELYRALFEAPRALAPKLDRKAQDWAAAEQARLRAKALQEAREREAREAEERARQQAVAPADAPPPPSVPPAPAEVPEPKVMLGTIGARRGVRKPPAKAEITDLKALANHFATEEHPDLVTCLQKLADKAAKAKMKLPGCRMSWEPPEDEEKKDAAE